MTTTTKKKPKILKMPNSKNKKISSQGNSLSEFKKSLTKETALTDKEIGKLLGSK